MSDIVERLRSSVTQCRAIDRSELLAEAAHEIERLRLTDAEREAVNIAQNLLAGTAHGKSLGSLLQRLG